MGLSQKLCSLGHRPWWLAEPGKSSFFLETLPIENKEGNRFLPIMPSLFNFLRILDHGHSRGSITGGPVSSSHSVCVSSDAFNLKSSLDSISSL